jgi:tetratricopeptide (TPR) repeat protein
LRWAYANALRRTHDWKKALNQLPEEHEFAILGLKKEGTFALLIAKAECHLELLKELSQQVGKEDVARLDASSDAEKEAVLLNLPHASEMIVHTTAVGQLIDKAIKMSEPRSNEHGSALLMRGRLLEMSEYFEEAKSVLEDALKMMSRDHPDRESAAHRLGYLYLRLGEAQRAVDMATGNLDYISHRCGGDQAKLGLIRESVASWLRLLGDAHIYLKNIEHGMRLREKSELIRVNSSMSPEDFQKEAQKLLEEGKLLLSKKERICSVCNTVGRKTAIPKCSGCLKKYYCGAECQRKDWPEHKKECRAGQPKEEGQPKKGRATKK